MLNASDSNTFSALIELSELSRSKRKPIVVWVGAGASSWAGLPNWTTLADNFYKQFLRHEPAFEREAAFAQLTEKKYPTFFGLCKRASAKRFTQMLHEQLRQPTKVSAVYTRFLKALSQCGPPHVITTNVDQLLEIGLEIPSVLTANSEVIQGYIRSKDSFVWKIHGTTADFSSVVFTDEDYSALISNPAFRETIKAIFRETIVLFIGYGLADQYVLDAILAAEKTASLFGTGPHFICAPEGQTYPTPMRVIRYVPVPHKDHRSSIQVLEEISAPVTNISKPLRRCEPTLTSAHLLADFTPGGTWTSSQRMELRSEQGDELILYHGHGLIQSELPYHVSTALHDLVVGLICFDRVYVPMTHLGRLHGLVGAQFFSELVHADVLRFVTDKTSDAVVFRKNSEVIGSLS